ERGLLGRAKSSIVSVLQPLHLVRRKSGAFDALDVVLRTVMASVDQRDSQIHCFVQLAVERTPNAGIELQKLAEHGGTMRQRFLDAAGLAFQLALINFLNFRTGLRRFNQTNPSHGISSCVAPHIINRFGEMRWSRVKS